MEKEIKNAELTPKECLTLICKLSGDDINEVHYSEALKKLVMCSTQ